MMQGSHGVGPNCTFLIRLLFGLWRLLLAVLQQLSIDALKAGLVRRQVSLHVALDSLGISPPHHCCDLFCHLKIIEE